MEYFLAALDLPALDVRRGEAAIYTAVYNSYINHVEKQNFPPSHTFS